MLMEATEAERLTAGLARTRAPASVSAPTRSGTRMGFET